MSVFHLLASASANPSAIEVAEHHDSAAFPPFDPTYYPSQLFWLAVSFGLVFFLLSRVLLPRLSSIIEDRSDKIANDIDAAARMQREAEQEQKTYEKALSDARAKAHNVAESTRASVNADIEAEYAKAEDVAQKSLDMADAKIKAMRDKALDNVDDIAAGATTAMLEKLYGGKITAARAKKAITALN